MSNGLFKYIDSVEAEMRTSQKYFFEKWNPVIREQFRLARDFQIEACIDLFGGYWLAPEEYARMDAGLINFYDQRVRQGARIYLRGYDYYQADPLLHMQSENCGHHSLWHVFRRKWKNYQRIQSFDYLTDTPSVENWIGTLGLLEYLFTDLTSLRWFIFRNKPRIISVFAEAYDALVNDIETFSDIIGAAIACMLRFDFEGGRALISENFQDILTAPLLNRLLETDFDAVEKASIRTMREGDSLVLIYAAYLLKLKPFCENHRWKKIRIISNAFGAMNIGLILKHLMAPVCEVTHSNILYAQHRSEGDFVYDDSLIHKCCRINTEVPDEASEAEAVFIVDDSICFGKSYRYIKASVDCRNVYALPLTLNCNGMKYFKTGLNKEDSLNSMVHQSVRWAGEVNRTLPPFFSFWDFRQTVPKQRPVDDETFCFAMFGSDLLLKHLWKIYTDDITACKNNFLSVP